MKYIIELPDTLLPSEINHHSSDHRIICTKACMEAVEAKEIQELQDTKYKYFAVDVKP